MMSIREPADLGALDFESSKLKGSTSSAFFAPPSNLKSKGSSFFGRAAFDSPKSKGSLATSQIVDAAGHFSMASKKFFG